MNRKSSYISMDLFIKWITQHFLKHKFSAKVILLLDGHRAHCRLSHTACWTWDYEVAGVDQKQVLGAFEKLRKAAINFVMTLRLSVPPSVHIEQLGSYWTDFHEILYFNIFLKSLEKIQVPLKSDKNNGTLHEDRCAFLITSRWIILRMRNFSHKICRENQNTHFVFNNFFFRKLCRLWENVEKYCTARQATDDNIIRSMCFACRITKTTDTYSEYVTLFAFPRQNWYANALYGSLNKCRSLLYTKLTVWSV